MDDAVRTDVLILGAGPAGLMAAAWMARMGVHAMIIDQKPHHTRCGRADGLESRTLEILDSFGLGDRVWLEANHTVEIALWASTADGKLQRHSVSANSKPGWSRFQESTLSQAKVEEYLMEYVGDFGNVGVRREMTPTSLDINYECIDDHSAFPIRVDLKSVAPDPKPHLNGAESPGSEPHSDDSGYAEMDTQVEAKYLVGCDGARSWLRKHLSLPFEGENSNQPWGVLDIIPLTDFPDVRKRFIVKSQHGTLMMIPRERKLVRVYVELPQTVASRYREEKNDELLMSQVETIMRPYVMKTTYIDWSTIYNVGQRICPKIGLHNRIFLAGDAIHTHSPKAGQGMNVSMQDTFNLGWKLASVVQGILDPNILETYQQERLPVAKRLIALDQRICRGMCTLGGDANSNGNGEAPHRFNEDHKRALEEENSSASGMAVIYEPNRLVTSTNPHEPPDKNIAPGHSKPSLAPSLQVGARIPSMLIVNQSDAQPCHLHQILPSTGQWNLLVFGGQIADPPRMQRLNQLGECLGHRHSVISRLNAHAGASGRSTPFVGMYLIHCAERLAVELHDLPTAFRPWTAECGVDYGRVWADEQAYHHPGGGQLYKAFGIGLDGCMMLLRPDQHLAFLSELDDVEGLGRFLESVTPEECRIMHPVVA
ncbi:FAD binding domain-containing protein [Aspergillus aurantiobrunneus]